MSKKKRPQIKRLQYPLWFRIVFYILTILVPLILVMVEGYKSPSTGFKWTFGIVSGLVVLWSFVDKFIVANFKSKIQDRKAKLEHDYEIDVGNPDKIKYIWFTNEQKLAVFELVHMALWGALLAIVLTAIANGIMLIKGTILMIAICYVVAYTLKFIAITIARGGEDYEDDEQSGT